MTVRLEHEARFEQLEALGMFSIAGDPVLIHGSIGHAMLMGVDLPSTRKHRGELRDIDIFAAHNDKIGLETSTGDAGLASPSPLDGGLSGILIYDGIIPHAHKDGVTVELKDRAIFDELTDYQVKGSDGLFIRSFSPEAMLAIHSLEPRVIRPGHVTAYHKLDAWFEKNNVELPAGLRASIDEFHRAYRAVYPRGVFYRQLADVYATYVPETIRKRFRNHTHRFMLEHTGRVTPYTD